MTRRQRRALDAAHDAAEQFEASLDGLTDPLAGTLRAAFSRLHDLLHEAGAGQPSAVDDMKRLAEIGREHAGVACPLCREPKGVHDDDCPILGAMIRYPGAAR